jgi:hypothetical protein
MHCDFSSLAGFTELDLNSWDLAAGSLLVQEAGGRITDTRGGEYTIATRDCFATNGAPGVHDVGLTLLREAGAHEVGAESAAAPVRAPAARPAGSADATSATPTDEKLQTSTS